MITKISLIIISLVNISFIITVLKALYTTNKRISQYHQILSKNLKMLEELKRIKNN